MRLLKSAALVLVSASLIAGCSGGPEPIKADAGSDISPAAQADGKPTDTATAGGNEVTVDKDGVHWCENVKADSFKEEIPFTSEDFADAYCAAVTFIGEHGLTRQLAKSGGWNEQDAYIFADYFDNEMQAYWAKHFKRAQKMNAADRNEDKDIAVLSLLSGFDSESDEFTFDEDQAMSTSFKWSTAKYWVNKASDEDKKGTTPDTVGLQITFNNDLLVNQKGKGLIQIPYERVLTLNMSQTGDDRWLIAGARGSWKYGDASPVKE